MRSGWYLCGDDIGGASVGPGLILIWGQSNAVGQGDPTQLTDASYGVAYPNVSYSVKISNGVTDPIVFAGPYANGSLAPVSNGTANMGVEMSLGRDLDLASNGQIAIEKYAESSSGLSTNWLPTSTYPTSPGGGPNLFNLAMNHAAAAATAFSKPVAALVWIQGETDALTAGPANAYQDNLYALFAAFRAVYPAAAIVVLQTSTVGAETFIQTVRGAEATVVATIPKAAIVDASDLPLFTTYHYNADGLVTVGHRLATAIRTVIGLHADFSYASAGLTTTFTDRSTTLVGSIATWAWVFGDGGTSTSQNPVHTYAANGTYNVTLTVTGSSGGTSTTAVTAVIVTTTWVVDATSNKALPRNVTEWATLLAAASITRGNPSLLWNLQQAGGVATDAIGTFTGGLTGTGVTFQQAVSGWTTTGVTFTNGGNAGFTNTDSGLPDLSATSLLVIGYAYVSAPSANSVLFKAGTSTNIRALIRTGTVRFQGAHGVNSATGTVVPTGQVRPFVYRHNKTASTAMFASDQEKLVPTFGTVTGKQLIVGDASINVPATYLMMTAFFGAAAEMTDAEVKTLLQTMNWTIPWT